MPTLLAIGAHYDDSVFGVSGVLLRAVRKNYRTVALSVIGDYSNWKPVQGREKELITRSVEIAKQHGVEMRFLDFAEMKFDVTLETKTAVARAVADVQPDIALMLWPNDKHQDHVVASTLSKVALQHGDRLLGPDVPYRAARSIYWYDNGPGHTIGYEPDTYVDVSEVWQEAQDWLGELMAAMRNAPYDKTKQDGAQAAKEALARHRGSACGVRYAEALRAVSIRPREIL
jgi:LmbE family N-acetylglucosaminyl deacetylase